MQSKQKCEASISKWLKPKVTYQASEEKLSNLLNLHLLFPHSLSPPKNTDATAAREEAGGTQTLILEIN